MQTNQLWKAMLPTCTVLVLLVALSLLGQPALAGPTITVYKSPT
jgi:hypothetical protein